MNNNVLILITLTTLSLIELTSTTTTLIQNPRLLGGAQAKPGQFPYAISLQAVEKSKLSHICGGAIMDDTHVVTAAHCVYDKSPHELKVLAGVHNIKISEPTQQLMKVQNISVHHEYKSQDKGGPFDVAVLQLATPVTFTKHISSVPLPPHAIPVGSSCDSAGWGNIFPVSPVKYQGSDVLLTGNTQVLDKTLCQLAYPVQLEQLSGGLCVRAGLLAGTCQGDSGGPLICYKQDNSPYLAGLVSWGFAVCGDLFHPDVYTDMSNSHIQSFVNGKLTKDQSSTSNSSPSSSKPANNLGLGKPATPTGSPPGIPPKGMPANPMSGLLFGNLG